MAIASTGMPSTIRPKEVNVTVRGGPPADGRVRAAASTGHSARVGEAQVAQERASQEWGRTQRAALLEQAEEAAAAALRNERADQETRRSTRTLEDITARQKDLRVICEERAAEEEKKTGQQARLANIREQQASLEAQLLVRWLSTVPAEAAVV
jgi:hypothetical protein